MTTTVRSARSALKPTTHAYDATTGILHIATEKGEETGYFLDVMAGEGGAVAFALTKIVDRTTYGLAFDSGLVCTCPGFRYRGACRHQRALSQLIEDGTL